MFAKRHPTRDTRSGSSMAAVARRMGAAVCLMVLAGAAGAQAWPSKTIRIVNGFPPGGTIDLAARLLAEQLSERFEPRAIVENKPGAAGILAAEYVARAPADGYTLFLMPSAHTTAPGMHSTLPYNPVDDFTMISMVGNSPLALAVASSSAFASLRDLIEGARAKPGMIAYSTGGVGSVPHLVAVLLEAGTGTRMNHIPYKGGNAHLVAAMSGEVAVVFTPVGGLAPFVQGGKLRVLAVSTRARYAAMPDVPTIAEQVLPEFNVGAWYALAGPRNLPTTIVSRLNQEIHSALERPDVAGKLRALGVEPWTTTPAEAQKFLSSEVARWTQVIGEAKIAAPAN